MIAAARLGLSVAPAGHLGVDVYGAFLEEVLQVGLACQNACIFATK